MIMLSTEKKEKESENFTQAPLIEHLSELRTRLIRAVLFLFLAVGVCFYYADKIFLWLVYPLKQALGQAVKVSYFAPHEAFFVYMNLSFYAGLIIAVPVILHQIWAFVVPGLYYSERRMVRPFLFAAPMMFCVGGAFAYFYVLPMALEFFASFQSSTLDGAIQITQEIRVQDYAHFALSFILVFGLTFQLPIILVLLGLFDIFTADDLRKFRRYAVLMIASVSAIVTPPDLLSMIALAVPLQLLYEISILIIKICEKKRDVSSKTP